MTRFGDVRPSSVRLGAGVDLLSPISQINPSAALVAVNYECPTSGGYRSVMGYTPYDSTVVPGEGAVLGIAVFEGAVYAVRANVGGAAATLHKSTGAGWSAVTGATALPVGRYHFTRGNFLAQAHTKTLFMQCANSGKPYAWDGTTFAELTNAPAGGRWLAVHANHLWIGFESGSLQHSKVGDYTIWDGQQGAGEIGCSDKINGLILAPGGVLIVGCEKSIQAIYGDSSINFARKVLTDKTGAKAGSMVALGGSPILVTDRGLSSLQTTQAFGDFLATPWGALVDPYFQYQEVQCSTIHRQRNQVRLWLTNGTAIWATGKTDGSVAITTVEYPATIREVDSEVQFDDTELSVGGTDDGWVMRLDTGTSFNGAAIETFLTLAFNHLGSPTTRKRFRRIFFDMHSTQGISIQATPGFDYGDAEIATHRREYLTSLGSGGLWGRDNWGEFVWSAPLIANTALSMDGTAEAFNVGIYSSSATAPPHTLVGYTVHWTPRRHSRS